MVSRHPARTYACKNSKCPNRDIKVKIPAVVAKTLHRGHDGEKSRGIGTYWRWDAIWCECGQKPELLSDTLNPAMGSQSTAR